MAQAVSGSDGGAASEAPESVLSAISEVSFSDFDDEDTIASLIENSQQFDKRKYREKDYWYIDKDGKTIVRAHRQLRRQKRIQLSRRLFLPTIRAVGSPATPAEQAAQLFQ